MTNTKFFPEFIDPLKAAGHGDRRVRRRRPARASSRSAQVNDVWSIPSHENYPADGKDQLAQAAASVIDLTRLDKVTDDVATMRCYGVVDPDAKLQPGSRRASASASRSKTKRQQAGAVHHRQEVEDRPELHYVRVPGQDQVYMVEVKTDKLSTKFQNWIEEDLLKLNAFDIKEIVMDDHSVDEVRGEPSCCAA